MSSIFLAAGHNGLRLTSPDGHTWSEEQIGKEGEVYRACAFGNGVGIAAGTFGGANLFSSTREGKSWQTTTLDGKYKRFVRGLGFGRGTFIALGGDPGTVGEPEPFVLASRDGRAWGDYRNITGKTILRRFAFGNGKFVAVGDRGRRAASADGLVWKDTPNVRATDTLVDIAFGAGVFVGVGLHGLRMTSRDGIAWTDRQTGEEGEHLNAVVWAGDRFVAIGLGATYVSADGKTWRRLPNKDAPQCAAFGNGKFVGATWKGRLLVSDGGVIWHQVRKCDHHIEAVAFGELS